MSAVVEQLGRSFYHVTEMESRAEQPLLLFCDVRRSLEE
jgi:hypothetical protein